jgi:predicted permease
MLPANSILGVIFNTIAPIFLIVGAVVVLQRRFTIDARSFSRVSIYLLSPALFFRNVSQTSLSATEVFTIFAGAFTLCLLLALIGFALARLLKLERAVASAFILTVFIFNSVTFGFPFLEFALGPKALETAVIFSTGQVLTAYGLGTFVASRGRSSVKTALKNAITIPMPYAFLLGVYFNANQLVLPETIARAVDVLARAVVPTTLVILGLQLGGATLRGRWKLVLTATGTRYGAGALLGILLAGLFGLQGLSRQVFILEATMPSGLMSGVLTTEFGGDAEFAAATILVTTLLSSVFLSVLLLLIT